MHTLLKVGKVRGTNIEIWLDIYITKGVVKYCITNESFAFINTSV